MQQVSIADTGLTVSRFVFGTAGLFNVGRRARRRDLLEAAVAAGFTHFDTAPFYGFGHAERDLAPLLAAHPSLTFTTKVGLYSPGGEEQSALAVLARKAAGRVMPALSRPKRDFTLSRAEAALAASLRRTGREAVDLYLLHEPEAGLLDFEEWRGWLEGRKAAGMIREWGLAPGPEALAALSSDLLKAAPVLQLPDSLGAREADAAGRPLQLTYGYLSAALARDPAADAREVLTAALARNSTGAIVVTTARPERLSVFTELAR